MTLPVKEPVPFSFEANTALTAMNVKWRGGDPNKEWQTRSFQEEFTWDNLTRFNEKWRGGAGDDLRAPST